MTSISSSSTTCEIAPDNHKEFRRKGILHLVSCAEIDHEQFPESETRDPLCLPVCLPESWCNPLVVSHKNCRNPELALMFKNEVTHLVPKMRIEVRQRFVRKERTRYLVQKMDGYLIPTAFIVLFMPFTTSTTAMSSAS